MNFGDFRVEDWYGKLVAPPLTYKTEFLSLTMAQAKAIMNYYDAHAKAVPDAKKFTEQDKGALEQLTSLVQEKINSCFEGKPVFCRMSTRSPKDACMKRPEFVTILTQELQRQVDPKNDALAVIHTLHKTLQVANAKEAIQLLCTSERVFTDLLRNLLLVDEKLKHEDNKQSILPGQGLILREYQEDLNPELEFRAFVKNGKQLCALTQYFKSCHVSYIAQHKSQIEQAIRAQIETLYTERICNLFSQEEANKFAYVIDFAIGYKIHQDLQDVKIIEFNPNGTSTNAGMFEWNVEQDAQILRGDNKFEFRIVDQPFSSRVEIRSKLSKDVQKLLEQVEPLQTKTPTSNNACLLM